MAVSPGYFRLDVYRGDTKRWRFVLWQDDAKTIPTNLSGAVVTAQLRAYPDGEVSALLGCTVTLPNTIDAVLSAADSSRVVNGVWDLQLAFSGGDVVTALSGNVLVVADVTR